MEITWTLFKELLDCLACVAISAHGGYQVDENGEPVISDEMNEMCANYAHSTRESLLHMWECITGKEWAVVGVDTQQEE